MILFILYIIESMRNNDNNITAVLLLSCPDRKGLVAGVSNFIYQNNGNIIHADQHTDQEKGIFLQRVEWELEGFKMSRDKIREEFRPLAEKFGMIWDLRFSDYVQKTAVLVSKYEHCLYDIMARQKMGEFKTEIPLVISNHPDLQIVAESFGAKFYHYPIENQTRERDEKPILAKLEEYKIDLVVLARYMRILSGNFVNRYPNKIINIHLVNITFP